LRNAIVGTSHISYSPHSRDRAHSPIANTLKHLVIAHRKLFDRRRITNGIRNVDKPIAMDTLLFDLVPIRPCRLCPVSCPLCNADTSGSPCFIDGLASVDIIDTSDRARAIEDPSASFNVSVSGMRCVRTHSESLGTIDPSRRNAAVSLW
jgi:hypothetical protein